MVINSPKTHINNSLLRTGMMQTVSIEKALALRQQNTVFIDTRTPAEFAEDHLPGAVNIPILSDEERSMVGTLYKQVSQQKAIDAGTGFFLQKLPHFMEQVEKYAGNRSKAGDRSKENKSKENSVHDRTLIIYCWRGGMRSRAIAESLEMLGYKVMQLQGGYKAYRAWVRMQLENFALKPKLVVLWGLTCTGKTALLKHFQNSLDLEGLAQHRSSLYGAIGLKPHSQKRFDNLLLWRLRELGHEETVLVEGESRKIGDVQIPAFLYKAMLHGTHVLVTRSLKKRAEHARKEYFRSAKDIMQVKEVTEKLFKVISGEKKQEVVQLLEEGMREKSNVPKIRKYEQALAILLEHYYDPLYAHTLNRMGFALAINNDKEENAAIELGLFIKKLPAQQLQ